MNIATSPQSDQLRGELPRMLTPREVARRYGVKPSTVLSWVKSGELRALDVARRGSQRPRFRIDTADLIVFENGRAVTVTGKPKRRQRRKSNPETVTAFF